MKTKNVSLRYNFSPIKFLSKIYSLSFNHVKSFDIPV